VAAMTVIQVELDEEQADRLRQRAGELGVSEAALIRRAIDEMIGTERVPVRDISGWERQIAFARSRTVPSSVEIRGGRGWTREELYDERLDRLPC
jgi:hypothetical protein